jgi:DNA-binding LacI/PurR family transcriptional regulator
VPDDVSVVGFDDMGEAAYFWPPLTTIHQSFAEVGRRSVDALITEIQSGVHGHRQVLVPTELVLRASTAAPPRRTTA